jgi:hypothetical protein
VCLQSGSLGRIVCLHIARDVDGVAALAQAGRSRQPPGWAALGLGDEKKIVLGENKANGILPQKRNGDGEKLTPKLRGSFPVLRGFPWDGFKLDIFVGGLYPLEFQ